MDETHFMQRVPNHPNERKRIEILAIIEPNGECKTNINVRNLSVPQLAKLSSHIHYQLSRHVLEMLQKVTGE